MVQVSRRTGFTGSALASLLSRLTDIEVPEPGQGFADRLSHWFTWTDAILLSAALHGSTATAPSEARGGSNAEEGECIRTRAALANAIADETRGADTQTTAAFTPYRRRYVAMQQAMQASISPLRARLRATLAARSPAMARLAAVDAVMDQVLGAHEHSLLSGVPVLLEKHFNRLRQADQAVPRETQPPGEPDGGIQPGEWLNMFGKHMRSVLLAELDIRMQPVEGLLDALRTR
jgi:hypothetical protein